MSYNPEKFESPLDRHAKNDKERKECFNVVEEKIDAFKHFKSEIDPEKLPDPIKNYLENISNDLDTLKEKLSSLEDSTDVYISNHLCHTLGNMITSSMKLAKFVAEGKEGFAEKCEEDLEKYNNYFDLCVSDPDFLKQELETAGGGTSH